MKLIKTILIVAILPSLLFSSAIVSAEEDTSFSFEGFDFADKENAVNEESKGPVKVDINDTFKDLYNIFSKHSSTTSLQKEKMWEKYLGKYVTWYGIVTYTGIAIEENGLKRIGVNHEVGTNVELVFTVDQNDVFELIKRGDEITYTGKLALFFKRNLIFGLEDITIEVVNGKLISELKEELESDLISILEQSQKGPATTDTSKTDPTVPVTNDFSTEEIDETFDDLHKIFGTRSELTRKEKDELWTKYQGKIIIWQGIVEYKGLTEKDWRRVGIEHKVGTNVELVFDDDKKEIVKMIKRGDNITYTGRLSKLVGRNLLCKVTEADVKLIGDKIVELKQKEMASSMSPEQQTITDGVEEGPVAPEIKMSDSMAPEVVKKEDLQIEETSDGYISVTFDELDEIFGRKNKMTESQKDKLWKEYKGKYVHWAGHIVYRGLGRVSGLRMGIKHKEGTDVELCFDIKKKDRVLKTKENDKIIYTGKLIDRRGYILPYRLEDGDIDN